MMVPGLQNLGNTCFFNAILQALASLTSVHEFLREIENCACVTRRAIAFTGALRDCLEALAPCDSPCVVVPRALNAELTNQLRAFRGNRQQDAQELLQFLFKLVEREQRHCSLQERGLLDLLVNDVPASRSITDLTMTDLSTFRSKSDLLVDDVPVFRSISDLRLSQAVDKRSWNPFQGLQVNLLQCATCHHYRPLNNQPFLDVSLSLVASGDKKIAHLTDALRLYTEAEVINDVECNYCSVMMELQNTKQEYQMVEQQVKLEIDASDVDLEILQHVRKDWIHTLEQLANASTNFDIEQLDRPILRSRGDCLKRLQFSRSPDVFCFHFNRKVYMRTDGAVKLETYVEFPLELDMEDFCQYETSVGVSDTSELKNGRSFLRQQSQTLIPSCGDTSKQQNLIYNLSAVILHHGNERCGHFTAYRRASASQWFFVSDETVREAPIAEVLSSCAYMLFYERKYRMKCTVRSSETEETTDDDDSLPDVPFDTMLSNHLKN
ncbi:ubiquitinspecific protease [Plasmopara halstedii]|uniref:Ubiquitin carboxyl-terminal hydrolase n=1 Tax=Plasmopara halstedii TaxID=4781 RepID=A0A0P1B035_PLAHL|nr:ubiquitinspecific protease [Plasmopara halstedii]CEG47999.1 ubiquitinspecific protease [Plasmopara halstedii]|eukprot:XP_024584368.1 ubiquitinspecific protease [Plasmopara halstedii]